tara:strand:- start:676 stop:993 length:318 start_codon:yes stop_codon:yes gene_type:complete
MGLKLLNNKKLKGLKGNMKLSSAMPLDKNKWLGHTLPSGDFMVMFIYHQGTLSMGMAECEYDLISNMQVVAVMDNPLEFFQNIVFEDILLLLDWECADYMNAYYD